MILQESVNVKKIIKLYKKPHEVQINGCFTLDFLDENEFRMKWERTLLKCGISEVSTKSEEEEEKEKQQN